MICTALRFREVRKSASSGASAAFNFELGHHQVGAAGVRTAAISRTASGVWYVALHLQMLTPMLLKGLAFACLIGNAFSQRQEVLRGPLIDTNYGKVAISDEVSRLAERLVNETSVPGLAIGVVRPDKHVEVKSWGIRSEEGDKMTTDVREGCLSVDLTN